MKFNMYSFRLTTVRVMFCRTRQAVSGCRNHIDGIATNVARLKPPRRTESLALVEQEVWLPVAVHIANRRGFVSPLPLLGGDGLKC